MAVQFANISDLKKQAVSGTKGFPVPMWKQMSQPPRRKVSYPKPDKPKK
jgi:hypothetical protein